MREQRNTSSKIIAIASGKGGTGKTTVATNLALVMQDVVFIDCDAEEPNAHLFLNPKITAREDVEKQNPVIDESLCDYCGKCAEFCQHNALAVMGKKILFLPHLCHSCGGCAIVCPRGAISEKAVKIGTVERGQAKGMDFIQGRLEIGQPTAVPIIKQEKSHITSGRIAILDCPPGTSCPVVESLRGVDYCMMVTEPTPFGLHDLSLAVEMVRNMNIPCGVVINQADIGDEKVKEYCQRENVYVLAEIPYDRKIAEVYSRGGLIVEELPQYRKLFEDLVVTVKARIN